MVDGGQAQVQLDASVACKRYRRGNEAELDAEFLALRALTGVPGVPAVVGVDFAARELRLERLPIEYESVRRHLGPEDEKKAFFDLLHVLRELHARGLVHGDISPGNVMLTPTQTVLIDFGLVQHAGASAHPGTREFSSLGAHTGAPVTSLDDLESLFYAVCIRCLPWDGQRAGAIRRQKADRRGIARLLREPFRRHWERLFVENEPVGTYFASLPPRGGEQIFPFLKHVLQSGEQDCPGGGGDRGADFYADAKAEKKPGATAGSVTDRGRTVVPQ